MRVLETCLYAENLPECRRFYVELLGLTEVSYDENRDLFLRLENSMLIVFKASKTLVPDAGVPPHGCTGPGHVAFTADAPQQAEWLETFRASGVPILMEKKWSNGATSLYVSDPAGNVVEFADPRLWFPDDKMA